MPITAHQQRPFSWRFVTPLLLGSALNPVNSTLIATALVSIAHSLGVSVGRTTVLVSALYLACAVAQPTAGKLAEELGPRRVFLGGTVLVLAGGLIGGLSHDLTSLIVARAVIGIGTSAGYPCAMLLVRRRATAAGLYEPPGGVLAGLAIVGLALIAVGPPLGGLLVGALGWRSTFLINIPFAVLTLVMTALWLPRDTPPAAGARRARDVLARIDLPGIAGFAAAMTCLLFFLVSLPHPDLPALAAAAVLAAALVRWEMRTAAPFLDVRRLGSNGALTRTYLRSGLTMLGVYAVLYGLPQWLEAAHGLSAGQSGLLIVPMGVAAAVLSTWVSRRGSVRSPLLAAGFALALGAAGILLLTATSPRLLILLITLLFGVTLGAGISAGQTALYLQAAPDQVGTASGLLRTFTYVGSIASSTLTGIVFRTHVDDSGLHTIALILIAVGALTVLVTAFDRALHGSRRGAPPSAPLIERPATERVARGTRRR
ncbi:MFS transporter [Actinacidiphila acididurans]|uniref:MFS transporter n=1 Tax=Actinacidiphila acididurans TaxID=2784346 RepID=A0ABS2U1T3_9ACTN|nr:MFS transporter [Actinacidiphila acididurans]MBM9509307.1 MFS transporter [Actinacidiphila acididurans]